MNGSNVMMLFITRLLNITSALLYQQQGGICCQTQVGVHNSGAPRGEVL